MAGSSAIIVAALRCLSEFYGIEIPREIQPSLVLKAETEELGIAAGLQDRVIQVYEGLVAMDFYIAYSADRSEPTEILHNNLRARYIEGDPKVHQAMKEFVDLTDQARLALETHDSKKLSRLMDLNFDTRRSICQITKMHVEMIERARKVGVSAKFAGSGGAIIGVCESEATFARLRDDMKSIGCEVIRPVVA
jgi:glucuronokinase